MPMNVDEVTRISGACEGPAGERPPATEAEAMQRLALRLGLGADVEVLLESEALNTLENAVHVRRMLEARGDVRKLAVVTSEFHMPRVKQTFELIFEGSSLALAFHESSDAALTAAEREREDAVEPAMTARLLPQAKIYRRYLAGEISLEEARRRFFHKDEPHSDVWLIPVEEVERVADAPDYAP
mmetsp:Transcript_27614/g.69905  ORF Transcript_27614/g.69905 Transcript_27614/m.69905 type:complete len:185 (-) Transcript_27614:16-570(-)